MSNSDPESSNNIIWLDVKNPTTKTNPTIEELSWNISNDIKKILVSETDIINEIIEWIVDKLNIENKLTRIKILHFLLKFINNKTDFLYNKTNQKIIWIELTKEELFQFINELGKIMLKDEHLIIKSWIHKNKTTKLIYLRKIESEKSNKLKNITKSELKLYNINALLYRLEDKWLPVLSIELDKSLIHNEIKQEENKIVELDKIISCTTSTIDSLNQELMQLKEKEA